MDIQIHSNPDLFVYIVSLLLFLYVVNHELPVLVL